ncbi:MAG: hypothetical protein UT42_C0006G0003 [Candidatus Falkowbacteria bacterium GW2011_GWA2_39_24]|uniref:Type I restriction modification DNA specificity domain-containing protein n=1 Tax=Candidatus Falkowbacteria bacterium GW2011_GWA2_39_24 TaxID=1618634 RepID=A0A0G0NR68_9BACT|nr:MAG: hypothetical protein UT42_C0006G0003 [Candidatus Falkowbacteria bacterium GW2011_GWA2_39_24]
MPQISYIKYKDIQEAGRYDAEYFKPEYLKNDKKISSLLWKRCVDLTERDITKGETPLWQGFNYLEVGVPFVRSQNFKNFGISKDELVFVSKEYNQLKKRSIIKYGDTLLAIVGATIGEIGFYDLNEDGNCNQAVAIISPKVGISKEYFNILFRTKNIQLQIKRTQGGNARDNFDLFEVRNLKIPILSDHFQVLIEQIVKQAYQKQIRSKELWQEGEKLLFTELGLLNYQVKNNLSFSIDKKEIDQAKRIDSEYFQPKFKEIIKIIEKYNGGYDFIGEIIKWKKGIEVGTEAYAETGKDFIRVSDFSDYGIIKSDKKISTETFEELKKSYQPKQGEILFTKDGTIGISYLLKENIEGILSGAFLRLSLREKYQSFEKECLTLILNSFICKMQIEKLSGGALIAHLKPSDFETFKIPLIKQSIQKQITEKIQESYKLRKESKNLLEEAKRKVEEEIEK